MVQIDACIFARETDCTFQGFWVDLVKIWKGITKGHSRHYNSLHKVSVPPQENLPFDGGMAFGLQLLGQGWLHPIGVLAQ